jgi:uncharacterized phiE125 gp8 family phage protein
LRGALHRFPLGGISIPMPPTQGIESITYVDLDGEVRTLAEDAYQVAGIGSEDRAEVYPAYGAVWPATRPHTVEAVKITFVAGYADAPDGVPATIRNAIMEIVAQRYGFRASAMTGQVLELPASAADALANYKVWEF